MKRIVLVFLALLAADTTAFARSHHVRRHQARHERGIPIVAGNNSILINGVGEVLSSPPPLPRPTTNSTVAPPAPDVKPASPPLKPSS